MSNRMKQGMIVGLIFCILLIICIFCFKFNSHSNSPEYAIKTIEDSLADHDKNKFNSVVDLDSVLGSSYEGFVDGMIDFDKTMPNDLRESITKFSQVMKVPMTSSMKVAIENYVEHGNFDEQSNKNELPDQNLIAASEIMKQSGLDKIEFRQIDDVKISSDNSKLAIAEVRVYQQEAIREFVFEVELKCDDNGNWKVTGIKNFRNFINMVNQIRRDQLDKYLDETGEIISRHDKTIREAEQKYGSILSIGNLSKDDTRDDLKTLITDVVKKDWEVRKQELFNVTVPKAAETIQNLRIKICDLSIESADLYAKWLSDKKAQTIKDAEDKRKQTQVLLEEERLLINRIAR